MRSPAPRTARCLALAIACTCAVAGTRAAAQQPVQSAAPPIAYGTSVPAWVEPIAVPVPRGGDEGGLEILLSDRQWRFDERAVEFVRIAYRVQSTAGLTQGSEIAVSVGSSEALEWHYVRRVRDGASAELLDATRVRVIQPEARLDGGLYDETRQALLFLEDVRVGDVIEYAYSRSEGTEILGGRHAARALVGATSARHVHFAASWPASRALRARVHETTAGHRVAQDDRGVRVDAFDVEPTEIAGDAPGSVYGQPWVELTEFADWGEVVRWALAHYELDGASAQAAIAEVPMDRFRAAGSIDAQAEAALRFVQDEVRYLGVEVRERALVPHPPAEVARRRYGDCKDKSFLLVTVLRALGVEADVALTHGSRGTALDDELPSPAAFDHVVVRARLGDAEVWLDPTRTFERGRFTARPPLPFRRALPIAPGTAALAEIPIPLGGAPTVEVAERYFVNGSRSRLEVSTTFRGDVATGLRAQLDDEGVGAVAERSIAFYRDLDLEPRALEPMRVDDDDATGAITFVERYEIGDFWAPGERSIDAWAAYERFHAPDDDRPPGPVGVPFPLRVVHRIAVDNDRGWEIGDSDERVEDPAFVATHRVRVDGRRLEIEVGLETRTDRIEAGDVERYRGHAREAVELFGYSVIETAPPPGPWERAAPILVLLGIAGIVAGYAGARAVIRRRLDTRRTRAFQRKQRFRAGESAEQAIDVADHDEAQSAHERATCCGTRLPEGQWSRAQLAGARLHIHAATCTSCSRTHRTYYRERARSVA